MSGGGILWVGEIWLILELVSAKFDMAKTKFIRQYPMRSTPVSILWTYLSTPEGLSEWFADDAQAVGNEFTFSWQGSQMRARMLDDTDDAVRFRWEDSAPDEYWELRPEIDELTDETILTVTDFSDEADVDDDVELWNTQIDALRRCLCC